MFLSSFYFLYVKKYFISPLLIMQISNTSFLKDLFILFFSLLVNYFYLKIVFDCIFQYIEIDTFTIIRMGRKKYHTMMFKRIVSTLVVFVLFSIFTDFLFYDICILGLIGTVFIEIVVGLCMSFFYKKLGTHTFMITFILIIFIKYLITLASGIMS